MGESDSISFLIGKDHFEKWDEIKPKNHEYNTCQREAGGGIEMGNTCKSMADSCQCMAKATTIL